MRLSPAAMASSRSLGHVGDLRGNEYILSTGSVSLHGGVMGELKVELFLNEDVGEGKASYDEVVEWEGRDMGLFELRGRGWGCAKAMLGAVDVTARDMTPIS